MNLQKASRAINYAIKHPKTGFGRWLYNEKKKMLNEPRDVDSDTSSEFKETLLLDNTVFAETDDEPEEKVGNEKMPKGEAVTVVLTQGEEIDIMLSKHKCKISTKGGVSFTDQVGRKYELKKGRNVVGRDTVSNVMMEPNLRDISRLHLVIENFGDNGDKLHLACIFYECDLLLYIL